MEVEKEKRKKLVECEQIVEEDKGKGKSERGGGDDHFEVLPEALSILLYAWVESDLQ